AAPQEPARRAEGRRAVVRRAAATLHAGGLRWRAEGGRRQGASRAGRAVGQDETGERPADRGRGRAMTDPPRILRVGEEPPPMEPPPRRQGGSKAGEGKGSTPTAKAPSPGRFGLLNAFVDGAMSRLSRAELAVWLCSGTAATAPPRRHRAPSPSAPAA